MPAREPAVAAPSEPNPLRDAFEEALAQVDATPLTGDEEGVLVGAGECELRVAWPDIQRCLGSANTAGWADRIAELLLDRLAAARGEEASWKRLAGRVAPLLVGRTAAAALVRRAPDVLVFEYAEHLLVAIVVPHEGGWRYLRRRLLDDEAVAGEEVLARALGNLRAVTAPDMLQPLTEDHYLVDSGDGLDSSRMLILDELLPEVAEVGALAAAPAREVLSFVPFHRAGCARLQALLRLATHSHARWPLPIDGDLTYVAGDLALHVPVEAGAGGQPRLRLPRALADIQAALVDSGRWG